MSAISKKCPGCKTIKTNYSINPKTKKLWLRCDDCKGFNIVIPEDSRKCNRCNKIKLNTDFTGENKKCIKCTEQDRIAAKKRREKRKQDDKVYCGICLKDITNNEDKVGKKCKICYDKHIERINDNTIIERQKKEEDENYCRCCKNIKEDFSYHRNGKRFQHCDECRKKNREYAENNLKCECGIIKYRCEKCCGTSLCEHKVVRTECKLCLEQGTGGGSFCIHKIRKDRCKTCSNGKGSYCIHRKLWSCCSECNESELFCNHNIRKNRCKECNYIGYLCVRIQTRINYNIHNYLDNNTDKYDENLQIEISKYIKYIEDKFEYGMNWNNYGEWHIDHINPINNPKTEDELYEKLKYTNTQPLWAFDNISKSNAI